MTNTKSARIEWIYVAKMFGLLLVTLGHGGLTTPVIRDFIYSFHMPLFFILSGILYKERTATENLTLQLKRIIVPYLLINAIILMYYIAYLAVFGDFDIDFVYKSIVSVLLGLGYNVSDYKPLSTPTWFFVVLFFSHMLMSICKTNRLRVVAMIVCLVSYKWLSIMNIDTFIPFDSTMIAFPFVVMGYYAKRLITPPSNWRLICFRNHGDCHLCSYC